MGRVMTRAMMMEYLNRWGLLAFAIAVLISVVLFLASLVVIYWADEYATPPWNERSVPAPRTY